MTTYMYRLVVLRLCPDRTIHSTSRFHGLFFALLICVLSMLKAKMYMSVHCIQTVYVRIRRRVFWLRGLYNERCNVAFACCRAGF